MALIATHLVVHRVFWAGKLSREEEIPFPFTIVADLMSKFNDDDDDDKSRYGTDFDTTIKERIVRPESLSEASTNGIYNAFADPNPSFRNIIMSTGFVN